MHLGLGLDLQDIYPQQKNTHNSKFAIYNSHLLIFTLHLQPNYCDFVTGERINWNFIRNQENMNFDLPSPEN